MEIIIEGSQLDIEFFLQKIKDIFKDYIRDVETEWGEASGDFSRFDIRF